MVDMLLSVARKPYPYSPPRANPSVPCRYFACDTEVGHGSEFLGTKKLVIMVLVHWYYHYYVVVGCLWCPTATLPATRR